MSGHLIRPFVMSEAVSVNIDSALDWQWAEWLLEQRQASRSSTGRPALR
jgi:CMP-N-acetylneuraminic acid synthetase